MQSVNVVVVVVIHENSGIGCGGGCIIDPIGGRPFFKVALLSFSRSGVVRFCSPPHQICHNNRDSARDDTCEVARNDIC